MDSLKDTEGHLHFRESQAILVQLFDDAKSKPSNKHFADPLWVDTTLHTRRYQKAQNIICASGSVQSLSPVWLFVTPWTAAHQAHLSITNSWSLLKLTSIESVMPSNHLILCHPLLLPSLIFPSIRVFSNESVLHICWPKYWSFRFSISPLNEYSGLIFFRISLQSKGLARVFSNTPVQRHPFFGAQLSL